MLPRFLLIASIGSAFVCITAVNADAQDKPKRLKNDQLMVQAASENGLGVQAGARPWHVRAQYETFDEQGKHKSGGTFEEWWFSPASYKSVFTGDTFKQTDMATEAGLFRSGDQQWSSAQEALVPLLLADPLSLYRYNPRFNDLTDATHTNGSAKLRCVSLLRKPAPDERPGANMNTDVNLVPSFCFDSDSTILRYASGGAGRGVLMLNEFGKFKDQVVARDIRYMNTGKPSVTIRVLDVSTPAAAAKPAPDANAMPMQGRVELPEGRMRIVSGMREALAEVLPSLQRNPDSKFELQLFIAKDGRVTDATVVSGPPDLAKVLIRGARKLVFEPFVIMGSPVEVSTTLKSMQFTGGIGDPGGGRRR